MTDIEQYRRTADTLLALDKAYHLMTRDEGDVAASEVFRLWLGTEFDTDQLVGILVQVIVAQTAGMLHMGSTPELMWASFYADLRAAGLDPSDL